MLERINNSYTAAEVRQRLNLGDSGTSYQLSKRGIKPLIGSGSHPRYEKSVIDSVAGELTAYSRQEALNLIGTVSPNALRAYGLHPLPETTKYSRADVDALVQRLAVARASTYSGEECCGKLGISERRFGTAMRRAMGIKPVRVTGIKRLRYSKSDIDTLVAKSLVAIRGGVTQ